MTRLGAVLPLSVFYAAALLVVQLLLSTCNAAADASSAQSVVDIRCSYGNSNAASSSSSSGGDALDTLYRWCVEDAACAELYYQRPVNNAALFAHLLMQSSHVAAASGAGEARTVADLQQALRASVCETSVDDALRQLWIARLKLQRYEAGVAMCDVNERFVVDPASGAGECVCRTDRSCSDHRAPLGLLYVLLAIVGVVMLATVAILLYRTGLVVRLLRSEQPAAVEQAFRLLMN